MALAGPRDTKERHREPYGFGVKANTKIWQGSLVCLDAGFAAPARSATGLQVIGRARTTVDNVGGAAGAKKIEVEPGVFRWLNSGGGDLLAAADRGLPVYAVDDQTVAKTDGGATRSLAGILHDVDASGAWVHTALEGDVSAALAAEIAARQAADLAATNTAAMVANLADNAVIGGIPVVFVIDVPDGATGDVDVVSTHKVEVLDVVVIKKAADGGANDKATLKNGATAITDAIDINVVDKTRKVATTIDDAQTVIAAGGTLRATRTKASAANVAFRMIVLAVRRA